MVQFLRHLLRQTPGKVPVIWDGARLHRGGPIKEFLAQGAAKRLRLEQLPGYAPELNPDGGIWSHLKYVELRNVCCPIWPTSAQQGVINAGLYRD